MIAMPLLCLSPSLYLLFRIGSYLMYSVVLPWGMNLLLPHLADYPTIQHVGYFIAH